MTAAAATTIAQRVLSIPSFRRSSGPTNQPARRVPHLCSRRAREPEPKAPPRWRRTAPRREHSRLGHGGRAKSDPHFPANLPRRCDAGGQVTQVTQRRPSRARVLPRGTQPSGSDPFTAARSAPRARARTQSSAVTSPSPPPSCHHFQAFNYRRRITFPVVSKGPHRAVQTKPRPRYVSRP